MAVRYVLVCLILILSTHRPAWTQQISPNPNPSGNKIFVYGNRQNNEVFANHGQIEINVASTLTNWNTLNNESGGLVKFFSGTLVNETGALINLKNGSTYDGINSGTLINRGSISTGNTAILNISQFDNTGNFTNHGQYNANGTQTNDGSITNYGSLNYKAVTTNTNTYVNHGTVFSDFSLSSYSFTNQGNLTNHGTWNIENAVTNNQQQIDNYGSWTVESSWNNTGTFRNFDTVNFDVSSRNDGTFINEVAATTELTGIFENYGSIQNEGALSGTTAMLRSHGDITNNGVIDTASLFFVEGTLDGTGTIQGDLVADSNTIVAPGNSAGVITIGGDVPTFYGTLEIELGGDFDGGGDKSLSEFDWLDIAGDLALNPGAILDVQFINGFEIQGTQSFKIVDVAGSLSGQFSGLGEGDLVGTFADTDLFISYQGGDGNDIVLFGTAAIPEPNSTALFVLGLGLFISRRRRRKEGS